MYFAFDELLVNQRSKERACDECNVCCILPSVKAFDKPIRKPCKYLCNDCSIYDNRPDECREYKCAWLAGLFAEDDLRPDRCGLLIDIRNTQLGRHFTITEVFDGARDTDIAKYVIGLLSNKFELVSIGKEVGHADTILSRNTELIDKIKNSKFVLEGWK